MTLELKVGSTYRAKHPREVGGVWDYGINDRTIIWMDSLGHSVQYDGPAVAIGRNYPKVTVAAFLKWASHEVTDNDS